MWVCVKAMPLLTIIPVDLVLWQNDLCRLSVVRVLNRVIQDTDSSNNLKDNKCSVYHTALNREVSLQNLFLWISGEEGVEF